MSKKQVNKIKRADQVAVFEVLDFDGEHYLLSHTGYSGRAVARIQPGMPITFVTATSKMYAHTGGSTWRMQVYRMTLMALDHFLKGKPLSKRGKKNWLEICRGPIQQPFPCWFDCWFDAGTKEGGKYNTFNALREQFSR